MQIVKNFHVALTFLTRLGRAHMVSIQEIQQSMAMYPMVGWVVGGILVLVALLPLSSWVLAWLIVATNIFVTRGLHWDGWADLCDALGSGATGKRFWEILKDSRIGAFGTLGLVVGLAILASLYHLGIENQKWLVLAWSCALGRFCSLVLAYLGRNLSRPGLGQGIVTGINVKMLFKAAVTTFLPIIFLPIAHVLGALTLGSIAVFTFFYLGKTHGGVNGDFLGAAIIAGELCALLPLAV
ncbi:MAG: adenosylcobinamide-GDP ribazoletransferase [Desulfovibrionales bacterium]|nr:adenosylcobinamide-GDP ribazoletransferase [Desulfovibrionales bacterium]